MQLHALREVSPTCQHTTTSCRRLLYNSAILPRLPPPVRPCCHVCRVLIEMVDLNLGALFAFKTCSRAAAAAPGTAVTADAPSQERMNAGIALVARPYLFSFPMPPGTTTYRYI